jgi:hypothetical protein
MRETYTIKIWWPGEHCIFRGCAEPEYDSSNGSIDFKDSSGKEHQCCTDGFEVIEE